MTTGANSAEAPVFAEPWQAEAFATAVVLSRAGAFTWKEWAETFALEIKQHPQAPDEDANAAYYRQWLAALETLLCARGLITAPDLADTQEHWRRSYVNTAHGSPVAFSRDWRSGSGDDVHGEDHDHHHDGDDRSPRPIAISAASDP